MLLKEIKEHYIVDTPDRGKTLYLCEKVESVNTRSRHKFLVTAKKAANGVYWVYENHPCSCIEDFVDDVNLRVDEYQYDSNYYDPRLVPYTFVDWIVMDKLSELGFSSDGEYFILNTDSIYGDKVELANIHISGLRGVIKESLNFNGISSDDVDDRGLPKNVKITLKLKNGRWMEGKPTPRNVEDILEEVKSLTAPLLIANAYTNFSSFDKLNHTEINADDLSINKFSFASLETESANFKQELIAQLETMLTKLKK